MRTEANDPIAAIVEDNEYYEQGKTLREVSNYGLTKLEYFSAHAPNEIPEWFKHTFKSAPVKPQIFDHKFGKASSHPQKDLYVKFYDDEGDSWVNENNEVPESFKNEVATELEKWQQWNIEEPIWRAENNIVRYFQWRVFYANQIINALNTTTHA